MKKCKFCAEDIQDEAIKCRFCGSDLNLAEIRKEPIVGSSSTDARSVAKGLKQLEQDKFNLNLKMFFSLILAIFIGLSVGCSFGGGAGWFVGFLIMIGLGTMANKSYHKE